MKKKKKLERNGACLSGSACPYDYSSWPALFPILPFPKVLEKSARQRLLVDVVKNNGILPDGFFD